MAKAKKKRCGICKKMKTGVRRRIDPYLQELFGKKKQKNFCKECYKQHLDDI